MSAIRPRKPLTQLQLDARRTAIAKTLWHISRRRARPGLRRPPFNSLGLAVQQAVAENA